MTDTVKVKAFVQNVLGCGCGEEVFRVIEVQKESFDGVPYDRIDIGHRLLVYVFRTDNKVFITRSTAAIVDKGTGERDSKGFNRFRLVWATDQASPGDAAQDAFEEHGPPDDRVYVHIVGTATAHF
jgi:hypothetical protein